MTRLNSSIKSFKNRFDCAEERITELGHTSFEISQIEKQKEKRMEKKMKKAYVKYETQ